ncbi:MAG TPA: hypothetical protein VFS42_07475 [Burkholderiaceae bacterium]|nr:hypothetical protein [Burkholderiaceae bacterium]
MKITKQEHVSAIAKTVLTAALSISFLVPAQAAITDNVYTKVVNVAAQDRISGDELTKRIGKQGSVEAISTPLTSKAKAKINDAKKVYDLVSRLGDKGRRLTDDYVAREKRATDKLKQIPVALRDLRKLTDDVARCKKTNNNNRFSCGKELWLVAFQEMKINRTAKELTNVCNQINEILQLMKMLAKQQPNQKG